MKPLFYLPAIALIALLACNKTAGIRITGSESANDGWQLAQKLSSIAASFGVVIIPSTNSSVLLALNADNTYITELNGQIISQGTYSTTIDTSYNNTKVLQLNNFITTGIFNLLPLEEFGSNGQVLSVSDGLFMTTSNDTLTLTSPFTPGGYISYTFLKK